MAESTYQRLTKSRNRSEFAIISASRSSLWLGADHLLCLDSNGYAESYKRFYFRDIQAITFKRTKRYQWWNVICGILTAGFLLLTILTAPKTSPARWTSGEIAGGIVLGFVTGLCLLLLVINWSLGPTCKCALRTAVQTEDLPSLCRVRRSRNVLEKIRPLITTVQGQLTAEEISARLRESLPASPPPSIPPNAGVPPVLT